MYDYLILTAAITRPDLHAELFRRHLTLIGAASVKWLVNIDDVGNGHTVAETAGQFERLLDVPNVDLEVLHRPGPGCFFRASRALARRAAELLDDCRTGVIWLEDDWALQERGPGAEVLTALRLRLSRNRLGGPLRRCPGNLVAKQRVLEAHERRHGPRWFVSLVPRSRVSFNPGIWSRALFQESLQCPLEAAGENVDDPETLCADPLNDPDRYNRLKVLVDPRYQDAGRLWSARSGLRKWQKSAAGLQARGAVSYQAPPEQQPPAAPAFDLDATVLCPDLLLNTPLRILCRTRRRGAEQHLGIAGVPEVSFTVIPETDDRAELFMHRLHAWSRTYPVKQVPVTLRREAHQVWVENGGDARSLTSAGLLDRAWRPGVQVLLGLLASAASLPKILARLDAE